MPINWRRQIISLLLTALFVSFTLAGLTLINLTFTITPFTMFNIPTTITINVGAFFLLIALATFALILRKVMS